MSNGGKGKGGPSSGGGGGGSIPVKVRGLEEVVVMEDELTMGSS